MVNNKCLWLYAYGAVYTKYIFFFLFTRGQRAYSRLHDQGKCKQTKKHSSNKQKAHEKA